MSLITKRGYGKWIAITSTAIVSGVLWFNRPNPYAKTEDIAELYAAVVERNVAYQVSNYDGSMSYLECYWPYDNAYLGSFYNDRTVKYRIWYPRARGWNGTNYWTEYEGTGVYDQVAGWITGTTSNEAFYGKHAIERIPLWSLMFTHIMTPIRNYAVAEPLGDTSAVKIWWLTTGVPEDGDPLSYADVSWSFLERNPLVDDWYYASISNRWSDILTTSTTVPNYSTTAYVTQSAVTNLPLSEILYPEVNVSANTVYGDYGNWWSYIGAGTDVFTFWNEVYEFDYFESVIEKSEVGGSIDKDILFFTHSNWNTAQTVTISALAAGKAVAYKILEPDGISNGVFGAASDSPHPGESENGIRVQDGAVYTKMLTVDTGTTTKTITFRNIYSYIPPHAAKTVTFTYYGDATGPESTSLTAGADTTYIDFKVPEGGAGVIYCVTTPTDNTYYPPWAMSIVNPHPTPYHVVSPVATFGTGYPYVLTTTTPVSVTLAAQPPEVEPFIWYDKRLVTNTLNSIRNVITNLQTTVAWIRASRVICSNRFTNTYYVNASTNTTDGAAYPTPADLWALALTKAPLGTRTYQDTTPPADFEPVLYGSGTVVQQLTYTTDGGAKSRSSYFLSAEGNLNTGIRLQYPSTWAYQNGYVKSVKIFAVTHGLVPQYPFNSRFTNNVASANTATTAYDGIDFGLADLSPHGYYDSFTTLGWYGYWVDHFSIATNRLELVAEATDPTEPVTFDMGSTNLIDSGYANALYGYGEGPDGQWGSWDAVCKRYVIGQSITVQGFLVAVEWNFQHMSGAPFVPDPMNDPEWTKAPE